MDDKTRTDTQPVINQGQPISPNPLKEKEPVSQSGDLSEYVNPSGEEIEPKIGEEVSNTGVKEVSNLPNIEPGSQVTHSIPPLAQVISEPSGDIQIPSKEEISKIIKTTSVNDSRHELAMLWDKFLRRLKIRR